MRPIFFLHIPKTAGTSIHEYLEQLTGGFYFLQYGAELSVPLSSSLSRYPSVGGHLRMADITSHLDPFVLAFTVMREPLDRFLSLYYFLREPQQSDRDPMVRLARTNTLEQLTQSTNPLVAYMANQQSYFLSALPPPASMAEHTQSAIASLDRFHVVGFLDTLAEDLNRLAQASGAAVIPTLKHLNKTSSRENTATISPELMQRVRHLVRFDEELCAAARRQSKPTATRAIPALLPFAAINRPTPAAYGSRRAVIDKVMLHHRDVLKTGDAFLLEIAWHALDPVGELTVGFSIRDFANKLVYGTNNENLGTKLPAPEPLAPQKTLFKLEANFSPGIYHVDVALHARESSLIETFHWWERATSFEVFIKEGGLQEGYTDAKARLEDVRGPVPSTPSGPGTLQTWIKTAPSSVKAGTVFQISLELFNGSTLNLVTLGQHPFHLSYHLEDAATGAVVQFEGARTRLIPGQEPRTMRTWIMDAHAPKTPGRYLLQPRLVQEKVRWISPPELVVDRELLIEVE